jgi:hypothetical protein
LELKVAALDVCYVVREGDDNEELRYSLRSLSNLPHDKVFIAGYRPIWVQNVIHISVKQGQLKHVNSNRNLLMACRDRRLSSDFIFMNDDFFIMQPINKAPILRRLKPIEYYIDMYENFDSSSHFLLTMKRAKEVLNHFGIEQVSSYDLHVPMVFNKTKYLELYKTVQRDFPGYGLPHRRTIYGNYYNLGGRRMRDVKILSSSTRPKGDEKFLSTIAKSFECGKVGDYIRQQFPDKSKYEE